MAEVYRDNVYAPYLQGNDLTILDIGANIGITSYYFSQFAKMVYSLEPAFEHFNIFTKMVAFNKIENIKPIKKALYLKNGTLPFYHNPNATMYSLHQAVHDSKLKSEKVECTTLEDLFKQEKIKHVDFMKLDIEGTEAEVLSHSSFKNVASKIDTIIVERHKWSGRHPNQLVDALKMNGYRVEQIPNQTDLLVAKR